MSSWPKIIRDPVHNLIAFEDTPCDQLLLRLINTREFQRLRRIKQLGFSQLTFPGADHSRFAHSIGVMHIARRFLQRINSICSLCVSDDERNAVLCAALLHDLGHGPFSHAFEKITKEDHESRTLEIILNAETEVNQTLRDFSSSLPDVIASFFDEDAESSSTSAVKPYLTQIVSSQFDADRFDYLLRDSYATGSISGKIDVEWLIQHLEVDQSKNRFYLQAKAISAAEAYVFARYHMYRSVYFHKATRAAEVMMKLLFERFKELVAQGQQPSVAPDVPSSVVRAFSGKLKLQEYLLLDDHTITEFAKGCSVSSDNVLKELSIGLLERKLLKAIDVSNADSTGVAEFARKAEEIVTGKASLPAKYCFAHDKPGDTPYKPYIPDAEKPATQIYVQTHAGAMSELSRVSEHVANLTKKYTLTRYYFPASCRDQIVHEAIPLLQG